MFVRWKGNPHHEDAQPFSIHLGGKQLAFPARKPVEVEDAAGRELLKRSDFEACDPPKSDPPKDPPKPAK